MATKKQPFVFKKEQPFVFKKEQQFVFKTLFHKVVFDIYNHFPACFDNVNFIVERLDEEKIDILSNIYLTSTQFTRDALLNKQWAEWYSEEEDAINGTQIDILIFMLDAYTRRIALKRRAQKLKKI